MELGSLQWKSLIFAKAAILLVVVNYVSAVKGMACQSGLTILKATAERKTIKSPKYPENYPNNELCRWLVQTDADHQVVELAYLDLQTEKSPACYSDYLEVRDGFNSSSNTLAKWCGKSIEAGSPIKSTDSSVLVIFRSNGEKNDKGFVLQYWSITRGREEFKEIRYTAINWILYGFFALLVIATGLSFGAISYLRKQKSETAKQHSEMRKKTTIKHVWKGKSVVGISSSSVKSIDEQTTATRN